MGDEISKASKVVTDTAEAVVQVSGVGKAFEDVTGLRVEANIHDNGLNTKRTGGQGILANDLYAAETNLKVSTSGNDWGIQSGARGYALGEEVARAHGNANTRGVDFGASVGFNRATDFFRANQASQIWQALHKLYVSVPRNVLAYGAGSLGRMGISQSPVYAFRDILNGICRALVGKTVDRIWDEGLRFFWIFVKVSLSIGVGCGGALKMGMRETITIGRSRCTFEMYGASGKLGPGFTAFLGFMVSGNIDGNNRALFLAGSQGFPPVGCGVNIVIPYRSNGPEITHIRKIFGGLRGIRI